MDKINILGVKIDNITMDETVARVEAMLADGKKHQVVTPNPEFVMLAQKDDEFKKILNQADLAIPDGIGLVWASRILSSKLKERVTGTDLMLRLCERAAQQGWRIFLLGGESGVAARAAEKLKIQSSKLKIVGVCEGGSLEDRKAVIPPTDFLFVAYGAPKQEKWIVENLPRIPVKVAMGVGGAFDFIVGKQKRAPVFVQNLGLEWLWRLLQQPWRARRQLALIKFLVLVFWQKIRQVI